MRGGTRGDGRRVSNAAWVASGAATSVIQQKTDHRRNMTTRHDRLSTQHEYVPSTVGHGLMQCKWCLGTMHENALADPNHCEYRPADAAKPQQIHAAAGDAATVLDPATPAPRFG